MAMQAHLEALPMSCHHASIRNMLHIDQSWAAKSRLALRCDGVRRRTCLLHCWRELESSHSRRLKEQEPPSHLEGQVQATALANVTQICTTERRAERGEAR